jgi:hypothetical protein
VSKHAVVMYSGGLVSYAAAKRAAEKHGRECVTLLFADTKNEDPDLYRFLNETVAYLGCKLVTVCDGRDPWQVFEDEKFIGNSRVDPCSKKLKRELMDKWVKENCTNWSTILVYGLDWSERTRIDGQKTGKKRKKGHKAITQERGWNPWYPMDEKPYLVKADIIADLHSVGIQEPDLYKLGFPHNNCGGSCVKMGLAQARHLYRVRPETYLRDEAKERHILQTIPTTRPFLKLRRAGRTRVISMEAFRKAMDKQPYLFENLDQSGWGCGGSCGIE